MRLFEHTENGVIICQSKLDYIKQELKDFLDGISVEKQLNEQRKKPLPIEFNVRVYHRLETILLKAERPIANSEALNISADEFYEYYNAYCDLCCWIEEQCMISYYKSKPEFCNFVAITTEAFENIRTNGDIYQVQALNDIDVRIANSIVMAAESAEIKGKPAEFRLTAKSGIGHKIQTTTNKEVAVVVPITENSFTPLAELQPPVMPKRLKGKGEED